MAEDTGQKNTQADDSGAGQPAQATKPLEGKIETEKSGYASELVAYRVKDNLGQDIANEVQSALKEPKDARILLVDNLDYASDGLALAEIKAQARLIRTAFKECENEHGKLLKSAETPTLAVPSGTRHTISQAGVAGFITTAASFWPQIPKAVGAVADLLAYFRSDHKVIGRKMTVSKQALFCSTAGSLSGKGMATFIPSFYSVKASPLLKTLTELAKRAATLKTGRDHLAAELPESGQSEDVQSGAPRTKSAWHV